MEVTPARPQLCPGQTAKLNCATRLSGVSRSWTVNDVAVSDDFVRDDGRRLVIPTVTVSDNGTYRCLTTFGAFLANDTAELRVDVVRSTAVVAPKSKTVD